VFIARLDRCGVDHPLVLPSAGPGDRLSALALGLILGGAVGNLLDRIFRGEVVDFLHFKLWRGYTWPDFNLADSFIVVGVGLLILECSRAKAKIGPRPNRRANVVKKDFAGRICHARRISFSPSEAARRGTTPNRVSFTF